MALVKSTFKDPKVVEYLIAAGDGEDTVGSATISNTGTLGAFTGATVPAIASATYDLDVDVDGGGNNQLAIALLNTDDWDGIATKIQTQLQAATSSTETVAITDGKITITSATDGSTSTIVIAAGTAGSGGGDLIAAITALGADYTATIDTPVDGIDGAFTIDVNTQNPASTCHFVYQVRDSAGLDKTNGLKASYSSSTGKITIQDDGTTSELDAGDVVTVFLVDSN